MLVRSLRNYAVKAFALLFVTAITAAFAYAYIDPSEVSASGDLYDTLYEVFRDKSGDPDGFMTQEELVKKMLSNCDKLSGIGYTYGSQEHYLACDGFVSLVFRLTFGTVHEFERYRDKFWCKFDFREEHRQAGSYVDKYDIYRPGGTSVTWLYENYVGNVVEPRAGRKYVEGMTSSGWAEYLESVGAQPGDILFWDNDRKNDCWSHIGIYAGIEDGVPKMWHASSIKEKVCKQSLAEITCDIGYLDYVLILATTDEPVNVGLYVDSDNSEKDFSYSVYKDSGCKDCIGRISSICTLSEQSSLESIPVYPNSDKSAYERTIYVKSDMLPFSEENGDLAGAEQMVYKILIRIDDDEDGNSTLTYAVYGAEDIRYYYGNSVEDYDYETDGAVTPVTDFS